MNIKCAYNVETCRNLRFLLVLVAGAWFSIFAGVNFPQGNEEAKEIEEILSSQAIAWNKKDIDGFMQTYWRSPQLTFSSGGNTTRGWQATLERYKTKYPPEKMGELTFDQLETTMLGDSAALVLGRWHLKFSEKKSDGNFSLVLKKIDGNWKIIHDHSSIEENK